MSNVKYIYHPVMFGGKVLKVVRAAENDDVWVTRDNPGYPIFFKYMDGSWFSYAKPTSIFDSGQTVAIAAFEATDENRDALSTLYPEIYFEAAQTDTGTKADKLLRMYGDENQYERFICFVPDVGFVSILEFEQCSAGWYRVIYTDGVHGTNGATLTAKEVEDTILLVGGYTLDIEEHEEDDNE